MSLYDDYNYLLEGGFKLNKINNRKHGCYYSRNDNNVELLIFIKNSLRYYLKKQFNIIANIYPDETYIITDNDKIIIKIIDKISHKNIKNVPYKKKEYEMMLSSIKINNLNFEYGIIISNNENNINDILTSYDIQLFNTNNENYYDDIDKWLDKH